MSIQSIKYNLHITKIAGNIFIVSACFWFSRRISMYFWALFVSSIAMIIHKSIDLCFCVIYSVILGTKKFSCFLNFCSLIYDCIYLHRSCTVFDIYDFYLLDFIWPHNSIGHIVKFPGFYFSPLYDFAIFCGVLSGLLAYCFSRHPHHIF